MKAEIWSGAGNTFIISNCMDITGDLAFSSARIASLCQEHAIDGFLAIRAPKNASDSFSWDFYNSDGSSAEMCGNAARCVAQFSVDKGVVSGNKFSFGSLAGSIRCEVISSDEVRVQMSLLKV